MGIEYNFRMSYKNHELHAIGADTYEHELLESDESFVLFVRFVFEKITAELHELMSEALRRLRMLGADTFEYEYLETNELFVCLV